MKPIVILALVVLLTAELLVQPIAAEPPDPLVAKFESPNGLNDVAFSPDGTLLAAAGRSGSNAAVRVWNVTTQSLVVTLIDADSDFPQIERVAFSPDGRLLATANMDGDVTLWSVDSWRRIETVISNGGKPDSLGFSPDGKRLALSSTRMAVLYDLESGHSHKVVSREDLSNSFDSVAFAPNGQSLAVCRRDVVEFWDVANWEVTASWPRRGTGFFCTFSPDGRHFISGGGPVYGKKSVVVWDAQTGERLSELTVFRQGVFSLAISHSGKMFALSGGNYGPGGDLSLWRMNGPQEVAYTSFGRFPIQGLDFSPDDSLLAAGSSDGVVLVYKVGDLRGAEIKRQDHPLCGELVAEENRFFIVPLSKVPGSRSVVYGWKLELINPGSLAEVSGFPVVLEEWDIVSSAAEDRVHVNKFRTLLTQPPSATALRDYVVFGDVQNPGWNEGVVIKVYGDGSFVASTNPGVCLSYGSLDSMKQGESFKSVMERLLSAGFMSIPKEPTTRGMAHYRTRFIELSIDGVSHLRTDAEIIDWGKGSPMNMKRDLVEILQQEEPFLASLRRAGKNPPPE